MGLSSFFSKFSGDSADEAEAEKKSSAKSAQKSKVSEEDSGEGKELDFKLPPKKRVKRTSGLAKLIRKTGKVTVMVTEGAVEEEEEEKVEVTEVEKDASNEELVEKARQYLSEGKPEEAENIADHLKQTDLSSEDLCKLWTKIANVYYEARRMQRAVKAFRSAFDAEPDYMITAFNLGVALHCNQELEGAQEFYDKAMGYDENHPKVLCNYGILHFQLEDYQEAEACMKRAVEVQPDYAKAWDNLATALGSQNRIEEAIEACNKTIEVQEDYQAAWFKLGLIHFDNNDFPEALQAFKKCQKLESCRSYIDYHMAMIYSRFDRVAQAAELCEATYQRDKLCDVGPRAWLELCDSYFKQGDMQNAQKAEQIAEELEQEISKFEKELEDNQNRAEGKGEEKEEPSSEEDSADSAKASGISE